MTKTKKTLKTRKKTKRNKSRWILSKRTNNVFLGEKTFYPIVVVYLKETLEHSVHVLKVQCFVCPHYPQNNVTLTFRCPEGRTVSFTVPCLFK